MELHFNITNDHIKLMSLSDYPVSDSINHLKAVFEFDEAWDGFTKTALFSNGSGSRCVLLENDECVIPWETLTGRYVYISVYGVKDDVRITATEVKIPLAPSGYTEGKNPEPPTPTVYEQLLEKLANIGEGGNVDLTDYYNKTETDALISHEVGLREEADTALASSLEWKLIGEAQITQEAIDEAGENGITAITLDLGTLIAHPETDWYSETMIEIYIPKSDDINTNAAPISVAFGVNESASLAIAGMNDNTCRVFASQGSPSFQQKNINRIVMFSQWKNKKYCISTEANIMASSVSGNSTTAYATAFTSYNNITNKRYCSVYGREKNFKFPAGTKIALYGRF